MLRIGALLALCLVMTGCVSPHREWVAPPASGRVIDAQTRQVVTHALVARFEPAQIAVQAQTNPDGRFEFAGVRAIRWLHLDRAAAASYRVEAAGYQVFEIRDGGWAFRKDLKHDLGEIELRQR